MNSEDRLRIIGSKAVTEVGPTTQATLANMRARGYGIPYLRLHGNRVGYFLAVARVYFAGRDDEEVRALHEALVTELNRAVDGAAA